MRKINLIAQGALELSHRESADNDNDNTHQVWIIVHYRIYSVADENAGQNFQRLMDASGTPRESEVREQSPSPL